MRNRPGLFLTFFASLLLTSTGLWAAPQKGADTEMVWAFFQFNVPEPRGVEDYYYWGRVDSDKLYDIIDGTLEGGFITLLDTRYWNNSDDRYHPYEDGTETGILVMRVSDIVRIRIGKRDPMLDNEPEDTADPATLQPSHQQG
jgi:hypothetical protein